MTPAAEDRRKASAARRSSAAQSRRGGVAVPAVRTEDKEKVSLTLDRELVAELRSLPGELPLSALVNGLLHDALAARRLAELVDEMEEAKGTAPEAAYDALLRQWFAAE